MSLFPERQSNTLNWRIAPGEQIKQIRRTQHHLLRLERRSRFELPKLWLNHFASVADFNLCLLRHGGTYVSALEYIRRAWRRYWWLASVASTLLLLWRFWP